MGGIALGKHCCSRFQKQSKGRKSTERHELLAFAPSAVLMGFFPIEDCDMHFPPRGCDVGVLFHHASKHTSHVQQPQRWRKTKKIHFSSTFNINSIRTFQIYTCTSSLGVHII
eukprot:scaffold9723_cov212-Skeletonema_marinoi.AAC.2